MAYIYNVEPNTNGKVVLHTTSGDVDIELWSDQAPIACRNFVQLCMEGYYNNTIFHRIIKKMMIQGGDPTGTGQGGESIYGKPFKDEINPRLKFSHRGIVAMANENKPDTNHSQFFITLDATEYLYGKHTIFGKVVGNTLFNVLKMGDLQTDANDYPLYPPSIRSVSIVNNPFPDIIPREIIKTEQFNEKQSSKPRPKQVRNNNLLSFANDDDDEDEGFNASIVSFQQASGIVKKEELVAETPVAKKPESAWARKLKEKLLKKEQTQTTEQTQQAEPTRPTSQQNETPAIVLSSEEQVKERVKEKIREMKKKSKELEKEMKPAPTEKMESRETSVLTASEYKRQRKRFRSEQGVDKTKDTLAALAAFRSKLKTAETVEEKPVVEKTEKATVQSDLLATTRNDVVEDDSEDENAENGTIGWMSHKLKFVRHFEDSLRDNSFEPGTDMYVTYDPVQDNPNGLDSVREKVEMRRKHGKRRFVVCSIHRSNTMIGKMNQSELSSVGRALDCSGCNAAI